MKSLFRQPTLLCFSPPVMVATIVIELGLAAWVITRYMVGSARRLIIALLVLLAAFQLAEYNVCSPALPDLVWSRLGYVAITFLPPLGLHLVSRLRGREYRALIGASYGLAVTFAGAFAFLPSALNRGVCTGNYVIFLLAEPLSTYYGLYYMSLVALGLLLCLWPLSPSTAHQRAALRWMSIGYIAFTLPVLIINFLLPYTHLGIPSIMCGFAVVLAIVMGLKIAPLVDDEASAPTTYLKASRIR
jgi:hypothetical protein